MENNENKRFDKQVQEAIRQPSIQRLLKKSTCSDAWTLPNLFGSGNSLMEVPKDQLEECLEPVIAGLRALDAEQLLELTRVNSGGACLQEGIQVKPIHNEIYPPEDSNTVRYIHLQEVPDQYSMGIFVFPPHSKIPLHDHPGMCVLSRVLYGSLHRLSLDLPRNQQPQTPWWKGPRRPSSQTNARRIAYQNRIDHLQAPGVTVLYPYEGNLHEFVAGAHGAAVLDVLLPPYDAEHNRDCTFYHIQDCEESEGNASPKPVWIVPTGQPEDFHCLSGVYRELGREDY